MAPMHPAAQRHSVRGSPAAGAPPPPGLSPSSSITNLPVPFWFLSSSQPQTMGATHTPCAASALLAAPPVLTHLLACPFEWTAVSPGALRKSHFQRSERLKNKLRLNFQQVSLIQFIKFKNKSPFKIFKIPFPLYSFYSAACQ